MASRSSMVFCFVFLVALCLMHIAEAASTDCRRIGYGCFGAEAAVFLRQNRKVLAEKDEEVVVAKGVKLHEQAAPSAGNFADNGKHNLVGWELRKVPSGPDPLHHNGNSPQKPRNDP
ncbi:unnamed protein product [Prunus armeniaca]|uniref:Uncharacterized protein n=1 Tax=Prunus armeniaca TaxID=36596 RepID=A0A6J5XND2_PRUAR|nr:unnamed protein product [Prunus armeniaca]